MSRSFKREERKPAAQARRERRVARTSKRNDNFIESGDSIFESKAPSKNRANDPAGRKS